ncbi:MAG: hypothetical protein PVG51_04630 [Desulfosarcina sp.]|jgi:adenylate cyclase
MADNADRRKLAAILCADVKGYSKLMGEDESYTVGALKECRQLFTEHIQNHGGRVVNAPGDSILAEFPSVVSAVQCAVETVQNQKQRDPNLIEYLPEGGSALFGFIGFQQSLASDRKPP